MSLIAFGEFLQLPRCQILSFLYSKSVFLQAGFVKGCQKAHILKRAE